jgi:GxxExxY protein
MGLLFEIENFLESSGMSATAFGTAALGDPPFVMQLRNGRDIKTSTAERVRAFIRRRETSSEDSFTQRRKGAEEQSPLSVDAISSDVIGEAIRIHRELGPGLLESVYEMVLAGALARRGYKVDRQVPVDVNYDGMTFKAACKIDILVNDALVIEVKSVDRFNPVYAKQLLTYLRLTNQPLGLLMNFSGETMKEGIRRVVNNHRPIA